MLPSGYLCDLLCCLQAPPFQVSLVLLASQAKEEKKVTRESQVCLYQDQVEEMEPQGLLGPLDPLDSQATQVSARVRPIKCREPRAELAGTVTDASYSFFA